uniref:Elastin microfibril interfacer 1 n=1 Tax=Sphenodon punctatus TaxID=8508 RepID=A0A8D0HCX8_SPHPU
PPEEEGAVTSLCLRFHPGSPGDSPGPLSPPRYRSFLRPRYKVAYKTVSDMEWRCCPGFTGDDCAEGAALITTPRPRPRPARPNLSGFGNALSGLGGEGPGTSAKVQQLEETVQSLQKQLQDLQAKLSEDVRRAVEASLNSKQPADAAAQPEMKETISEIQRQLQRLDNRLTSQENGHGQGPGPGLAREVEGRLQESCGACLAGVERLQQEQAEDRDRLRGLEKLLSSVDQRNREAVESIQRHVSGLAGRLSGECCSQLEGRLGSLERRLEVVSGSVTVLNGQRPGPPRWSMDSRLAEIEGRVNTTQRSLALKEGAAQQQGALERVRGAVQSCTQICTPPGNQDSQISDILGELGRRVLENEGQLRALGSGIHQLSTGAETLRGELRRLQGLAGADAELALYSNRTDGRLARLEAELGGCGQGCSELRSEVRRLHEQLEACGAACQPLARRAGPSPEQPEPSKPLDGFSVIGGSSSVHLKSLQGELSEVILSFSSLNESLAGLQAAVEKHQTDLHQLGATKDRIIAEINRVQQEVTEHVGESEERFHGLGREIRHFGGTLRVEAADCRRASGSLEQRLAKLEGSCQRLDEVAGALRKIKEGLERHVSALWGCLHETNATLRAHGALLEKIHGSHLGSIHRRLGALNSSLLALQGQLDGLTQQDLTGMWAGAPAPGRDWPPWPAGVSSSAPGPDRARGPRPRGGLSRQCQESAPQLGPRKAPGSRDRGLPSPAYLCFRIPRIPLLVLPKRCPGRRLPRERARSYSHPPAQGAGAARSRGSRL